MDKPVSKKCSKCGEVKALTGEFWNKQCTAKNGFRTPCKACRLEIDKESRRNNPSREVARRVRFRKNNPKSVYVSQKKWRKNNPGYVTKKSERRVNGLPNNYIKQLILGGNITKDQITPEMIKERRNRILAKRLNVPVGSIDFDDIDNGGENNGTPSWI